MKLAVLSLGLVLMASPALAFLGLPIADDATVTQGDLIVSGGVTLESDINMYGGRVSYGLMDGFSGFIGVGIVDPDGDLDSEPFFQLGGVYQLPVDAPVDLAVRGSFGIVSFEESWHGEKYELDIWMLNVGVLASHVIDPMITVYGFGGISYQKWEEKYTSARWGSESWDDTETEIAIAGGALFNVNENVSLYGELAHIDEMFISLGGRFKF